MVNDACIGTLSENREDFMFQDYTFTSLLLLQFRKIQCMRRVPKCKNYVSDSIIGDPRPNDNRGEISTHQTQSLHNSSTSCKRSIIHSLGLKFDPSNWGLGCINWWCHSTEFLHNVSNLLQYIDSGTVSPLVIINCVYTNKTLR